MKLKYILVLFILGFAFVFIGAFLKLESLPMASELMMLGFALKTLSAVLLIIKLIKNKENKVLNS